MKCDYFFAYFQIELRTKMVEAKYQEDKLKLQQQHDVAVQKVPVFGDLIVCVFQ